MLLLWQNIVQLLRHIHDVTSSGRSSRSSGRRRLQLCITIAAESEDAECDTVRVSAKADDQSPVYRPRRVAVADPSSMDDQLKDDTDCSPWEIRSDLPDDDPPSYHSDDVPLPTKWNSTAETSRGNITRDDDAELAELIRHRISLDAPLQQSPHGLLW